MQEEGTSQSATCTVLKPCQEDPKSQLENEYAQDTNQPEEPPDIPLLDKVLFKMPPEEVESTLSPMENSADQQLVQRKLIGAQESGKIQTPYDIKDDLTRLLSTKILADDSSEKDSGGNIEPFGNNSILNVTTEQTVGKTFGTSSSDQLSNQCAEGQEDILAAVKVVFPNFASQTSTRSSEEHQVATPTPEKSTPDYFLNPVHQIGTFATNDDATDKNFTSVHMPDHFETGIQMQNDVRVKNNATIQTSQMPYQENFLSVNSVFTKDLQAPSLYFARKMMSVPRKVSFVPPSPETSPGETFPFLAQVQQDMLVPSEWSQIYGFSPNCPNKVIVGEQKGGVVHFSPAQTWSGNLHSPLPMSQSLYSDTCRSSDPSSRYQTLSANNLPRIPPDKPQCSQSTRTCLKMKLKKHSTDGRHKPYKDQRPNNDLLPKLDELKNPFY